jgi:hypothetical protein
MGKPRDRIQWKFGYGTLGLSEGPMGGDDPRGFCHGGKRAPLRGASDHRLCGKTQAPVRGYSGVTLLVYAIEGV